jgi:hypothetical protein
MALGSTQPLKEMSTKSGSWGKGGRCLRLQPYHHPVPFSCNLGNLTSLETLWAHQACNGTAFFVIWYLICGFLRRCQCFGGSCCLHLQIKITIYRTRRCHGLMVRDVWFVM